MIEYVRLFTWVYKLSKSRFIIIVLLSIINLFVDMFGIGSLFAMLSSFTNNDLPRNENWTNIFLLLKFTFRVNIRV